MFSVTALPDLPANGPCTAQYTGKITGGITVGSGVACISNATVGGSVTVLPGGQLSVSNTTIGESITSVSAAALAVCNSSIGGQLSVRRSTGLVLIGDGGDGRGAPVNDGRANSVTGIRAGQCSAL